MNLVIAGLLGAALALVAVKCDLSLRDWQWWALLVVANCFYIAGSYA